MNRWLAAFFLIFSLGISPLAQTKANEGPSRYELYSWKSGKEWNFSLVPSTKERKVDAEIKTDSPIHGLDKMKERLGNMNDGDKISWQARSESGLIYPDNSMIEEVKDYADSLGIKVSTSH